MHAVMYSFTIINYACKHVIHMHEAVITYIRSYIHRYIVIYGKLYHLITQG